MADFRIDVPENVLTDLRERLDRTIWPDAAAGWDRGTDPEHLRALVERWRTGFDWRAVEAELNELSHVRVEVDGVPLHAVVQPGGRPDATPLLLLDGWPDCFLRYRKVLPLLADHPVVVPSLPGYGFSGRIEPGGWKRVPDLMAGLMTELGHDRFVVSGGDVGSGIAEGLALRHPDRLAGLHLTDVPYTHLFTVDRSDLSEPERDYLAAGQGWQMSEGAYALLQSTKPVTLAYGLTDSPVGLAAWMAEKFRAWSEHPLPDDDVLAIVTLYWVTRTIGSSFDPYVEQGDSSMDPSARVEVPTGVSIFPHDIVPAPRAFAERFFDVRRWTEQPRGGHFGALEEPELFAGDLLAFVGQL